MSGMEIVIAIVGIVLSGVLSGFVAWKYGDLAGQEAAQKYEKDKENRERIAALYALLSQIKLIEKLARANAQEIPSCIATLSKLPTDAFEVAFISNRPPLSKCEELLEKVTAYLSQAYLVNAGVELYWRNQSAPATGQNLPEQVAKRIISKSPEILDPLNALQDALSKNLTQEKRTLN